MIEVLRSIEGRKVVITIDGMMYKGRIEQVFNDVVRLSNTYFNPVSVITGKEVRATFTDMYIKVDTISTIGVEHDKEK